MLNVGFALWAAVEVGGSAFRFRGFFILHFGFTTLLNAFYVCT